MSGDSLVQLYSANSAQKQMVLASQSLAALGRQVNGTVEALSEENRELSETIERLKIEVEEQKSANEREKRALSTQIGLKDARITYLNAALEEYKQKWQKEKEEHQTLKEKVEPLKRLPAIPNTIEFLVTLVDLQTGKYFQ